MTPPAKSQIDALVRQLRSTRFRFASELDLQNGIEQVLKAGKHTYTREHILGPEDRLDFWLPDIGLALEVKTKGAVNEVKRQLTRYALHDCVKTLLLVTSRMQLTAFPDHAIKGKPLRIVGLAASLL